MFIYGKALILNTDIEYSGMMLLFMNDEVCYQVNQTVSVDRSR